MKHTLCKIVIAFLEKPPTQIVSLKGGHIHKSWLVSTSRNEKYCLQKINELVFPNVDALMENIHTVCNYLQVNFPDQINLVSIPTRLHQIYFHSDDNTFWRMFRFIENDNSQPSSTNLHRFYEAGRVTGRFNVQLANLPPNSVSVLLENFHNTSQRYQNLLEVISGLPDDRLSTCQVDMEWLDQRKQDLSKIWDALINGIIPCRVTHNDTKMENVLFDQKTGKGLCLIDLDTVMPGNLLLDFGDAIRSMANSTIEDEPDPNQVHFRFEVFEEYTHGFISTVLPILSKNEIELMPYAPWIITIEQGIRFLQDYLQGNIYYKTMYPQQNLIRSRVQLKLAQDMENNMDRMRSSIQHILKVVSGN